jgi:hypothetical protein
VTHWNLQTT